jgi:hypothetical protein
MGNPSLLVAIDYLQLLVAERPAKFPLAALRWHGRLELEARTLTLAESLLALSALVAMSEGNAEQRACFGGCSEESGLLFCRM